MKILAVDTTTPVFCLGLYGDGKIYEYNLDLGRKHSQLAVVTIERALAALGWKVTDVDYLACGLGPGSFTGMRVGLSTIKGFAWALDKPLVAIPTPDILARGIKSDIPRNIVVMQDAKRNQVYSTIYSHKNGCLKRLTPYQLIPEDEFLRKIRPQSIFLGDALNLYREKLAKKVRGAVFLDRDYWYPKAHNLIEASLEKIKAKKFSDPFKTKPIYLYTKECQIRKATKDG